MALSSKVGSFNTGTGALGTTVVVNDVGFQPKVVFFWWNGRTGTTDAAGRANHQRGFGAGTSATDRRFIASLSQDTPTSMVTNETQGNAQVIGITTTADAIDGLLDIQTLDAGGFTLVVDDVFTASYRIHYLALGGADITNVETGQFTGAATAVSQDVTSLSFQPDFVLVFGSGQTTSNNTVRADSRIFMGAASGASNQAVWAGASNDGAATSQAMSYSRSGEFISTLGTAVTGLEDRATFTSFLSNGFRVNWTTVTTGSLAHYFVVIKGGSFKVDSVTTQTDTTTAIVETVGFQPTGVFMVSAGRAESTSGTPTDDDELSMGAFTSTTARVAMSMSDDDAAGTAVVGTGVSHDEAYQNLAAASGAVEGEMDVQSIDSSGFTMIMDDADPVASFVWYAAFGSTPARVLTADSGTFTETGVAATLLWKQLIAANAGAYTLTGVNATLSKGYRLTAAAGSFAATGVAATLRRTRIMVASAGSFAETGTAATLKWGHVIVALAGSYAETGVAVDLRWGHKVIAALGTFTLTGISANFLRTRIMIASAGAFTETGIAAGLLMGRRLTAALGSYALSGNAVSVLFGHKISASIGSYALSGVSASLLQGYRFSADAGIYSLSGVSATLLFKHVLSSATGVYNLTGLNVTLTVGGGSGNSYTLTVDTGNYSSTGVASNLLWKRVLPTSLGSYVVNGQGSNLLFNRRLVSNSGSYALSGQNSALTRGYMLATGLGSYSLVGVGASFSINRVLGALAGAYVLSGLNVALTYSGETGIIINGFITISEHAKNTIELYDFATPISENVQVLNTVEVTEE